MRIVYGGRTVRGCYTCMHKKRSTTQQKSVMGGYVAPLLKSVQEKVQSKPDMNRVIGKLQQMNIGAGFGAPPKKKRIVFDF